MASKASLRAYTAFGCVLWLADEMRERHGQDNLQLFEDALQLRRTLNEAADEWEDQLSQNQVKKIQNILKDIFRQGPVDVVEIGSMLLAVLEDMQKYVKAEKRAKIVQVIHVLFNILQTHYDEGDEWDTYENAVRAVERFNKAMEKRI